MNAKYITKALVSAPTRSWARQLLYFLLISKYGFSDVLSDGVIVLDPSRVAAQIVTGIGFIGAGLIFVQKIESQASPLQPLSGW